MRLLLIALMLSVFTGCADRTPVRNCDACHARLHSSTSLTVIKSAVMTTTTLRTIMVICGKCQNEAALLIQADADTGDIEATCNKCGHVGRLVKVR